MPNRQFTRQKKDMGNEQDLCMVNEQQQYHLLGQATKEQLMEQWRRFSTQSQALSMVNRHGKVSAFEGVNPCAEILLASRGLCNLVTVNVMGFVSKGELNEEALLEAQKLSARASLRMTCVDLELPKWDRVQKEHRLIGCSLTGWQDAMESCGYTNEQANALLRKLRKSQRGSKSLRKNFRYQ